MQKLASLFFSVLFVALALCGCGPSPPPTDTVVRPAPTPVPTVATPPPAPPSSPLPLAATPVPPTPTATEPIATATTQPSPTTAASSTPVSLSQEEWWEVRTLLAGPGEPGRLYAFQTEPASGAWPAERVRFLISDDYGETWSPFAGGLPAEECVVNVNLDYASPDSLYASTCRGLYRWSGSEWTLISPQQTGMVAVVYGSPEIIWATETFEAGAWVIRSDDGGATWILASNGIIAFNGVANVAIDPRDANTLYAVIWPKYGGSYLRRGTGSGQWSTMPTPLNNSAIGIGMTIDGTTGALYVTVTSLRHQIWRSLNPNVPDLNEVAWEMVHDFGEDVRVDLLASGWSPQGLALYANIWPLRWRDAGYAEVGPAVLHRSVDGGHSWTPLPIP